MSELIQKQLLIIGMMAICGMAAGLVLVLFAQICRRIGKHPVLIGLLEICTAVCIGWMASVFLYHACWGKLCFTAVVSFFTGLWLWKRIFCDKIDASNKP